MINILLVDDDVLALTRLKQLIKVNEVEVVNELTNPQDAIEYIKQNRVDILITDMKMPKVDGIELMKNIREIDSQIQMIAISSYKDFDYVKASFKEGSIDYILKHTLNEEIITKAIEEAVSKIKENMNSRKEASEDHIIMRQSKKLLKNKVIKQILDEEISIELVKEKIKEFEINIDINSLVLVVCEIDDYKTLTKNFNEKDKNIFLSSISDIINKVLIKFEAKEIVNMDKQYVLFLSYPNVKSEHYMYTSTFDYCKKVKENIKKLLNINLSMSIGECCSKAEEITISYKKCKEMISNKFFIGKGNVYDAYQNCNSSTIKSINSEIKFESETMYQKLKETKEDFDEHIIRVFKHYRTMKYPLQIIELNVIDMLNTGCRALKEYGINVEDKEYTFNHLYKKVQNVETIDEIEEIIINFYNKVIGYIKERKNMLNRNYNKHTVKCIDYIKTHYASYISLQEAADYLGVNNTYLSKIFKIDTGYNFTEYLNNYRIEKAKKIIETKKFKVKEIYSLVGFNNYNYFFKVFRAVTNVTPLEYERNIKK